MDSKQRRHANRQKNVFSDLRQAKAQLERLTKEVIDAQHTLILRRQAHEKTEIELHDARVELKQCRKALDDAIQTAHEVTITMSDLKTCFGEVSHANMELQLQLEAATKRADENEVAVKEVAKLRRRLANKEKDAEKAVENRKASTVRPF